MSVDLSVVEKLLNFKKFDLKLILANGKKLTTYGKVKVFDILVKSILPNPIILFIVQFALLAFIVKFVV
jgi:hypothetical protein